MDVPKVINSLKPRSGKSLKFSTKKIVQFEQNMEIFFLVLLSNIEAKIGVVMRNTSLETFNIKDSGSYLIKNLVHQEIKCGVPLFKPSTQSVFRASGLPPKNTLEFSMDELKEIEGIDISNYLMIPSSTPTAPAVMTENTLTLFQYSQMKPAEIKENMYVEVI